MTAARRRKANDGEDGARAFAVVVEEMRGHFKAFGEKLDAVNESLSRRIDGVSQRIEDVNDGLSRRIVTSPLLCVVRPRSLEYRSCSRDQVPHLRCRAAGRMTNAG